MSKEKQLQLNVEMVIDQYYNGMEDYPEDYPEMTIEECRKYVLDQIYDMKVFSAGITRYQKNICKDLKFLGYEYICRVIDKYAISNGIIKEE